MSGMSSSSSPPKYEGIDWMAFFLLISNVSIEVGAGRTPRRKQTVSVSGGVPVARLVVSFAMPTYAVTLQLCSLVTFWWLSSSFVSFLLEEEDEAAAKDVDDREVETAAAEVERRSDI
nr:hypothetical protein Iba_chr02dCG17730 [Ipomoea batatas]